MFVHFIFYFFFFFFYKRSRKRMSDVFVQVLSRQFFCAHVHTRLEILFASETFYANATGTRKGRARKHPFSAVPVITFYLQDNDVLTYNCLLREINPFCSTQISVQKIYRNVLIMSSTVVLPCIMAMNNEHKLWRKLLFSPLVTPDISSPLLAARPPTLRITGSVMH